ncbi:MAG: glycosyltransferase [Bacteroidales bacterium]|jgi:glycosyltransferase involved in cell wall biosynthesis|nr:glycosyltransferase [Bacteroidales bacterium]
MGKKILFVNFSKSWGGGENWCHISSQELAKRGYDILFFVNRESKLKDKTTFRYHQFNVTNRTFLNPVKLKKIADTLKKERPDAVILNSSRELKTVAKLAKKLNIERIIYRRGIIIPIKDNRRNRYLVQKCVTHCVANSAATTGSFINLVPKENVNLVHNGINPVNDITEPDYKSKKVIIAARLSHEKGVDLGIETFATVADKLPDAELHIYGTGKEEEQLKQLISDNNLGKNVKLLGFCNNIPAIMHNYSALFMPSRQEGFANVLLEAMSRKLPCIAFTGNCSEEVIINDKTGIVSEAFDTTNMGNKIAELISDADKCKQYGENGRQRMLNNFTLDKVTDQLVKVLED